MPQTSRKPIQAFLSYSSADRKFCAGFKYALEVYGADVFLAHQDISPSVEWQNTILRHLRTCDVFIPILTARFAASAWTDQESGIAFAGRKCILPVALGQMPYGFLSRYQAIKGRRRAPHQIAFDLFKGLTRQKPLRNRLRETIIKALLDIQSYDDAGDVFSVLAMLSPFSARQLDLIYKAAISNRQIHQARSFVAPFGDIVGRNQSRMNPRLNARLIDVRP